MIDLFMNYVLFPALPFTHVSGLPKGNINVSGLKMESKDCCTIYIRQNFQTFLKKTILGKHQNLLQIYNIWYSFNIQRHEPILIALNSQDIKIVRMEIVRILKIFILDIFCRAVATYPKMKPKFLLNVSKYVKIQGV